MPLDETKRGEIQKLIDSEVFAKKPEKKEEKSTVAMIKEIHDAAVMAQVQHDEETKNKFMEQAKNSVDNALETINQENIDRRQKTTYDANKEACNNYGVEQSVPLWQIKLMKIGSGVWFVIYWIFATLTICPINVFFKGIRSFVKTTWVVIVFAVLCYLIIVVGIPILITWLTQQGYMK